MRDKGQRKRRCRGCCCCCSSLSLFYCVVGVGGLFVLLNLLVDQSAFSLEDPQGTIPPPPPAPVLASKPFVPATKREEIKNPFAKPATKREETPSPITNSACDGYDGVFLVSQGDVGGAAGTIFFQFVIGQILYAERYNLKPFVHLNNISYVIYDPVVHGKGPGVRFRAVDGMNASHIVRPIGHWRDRVPGQPVKVGPVESKEFHLEGTGVWEHYFKPVSDFRPGDASCEAKPLVQMEEFLITPGIHGFAEWAPRCWRYQYAPDYATKPHVPLHEWLEPQRIVANRVVRQYIHFQPDILQAAQTANPGCSLPYFPCLGLHIRQSDKAAGRRQIQTHEFLPYAIAFVKAGGKAIYLATDSTKVLVEVQQTWPAFVRDKLRTIGDNVIRSTDDKAVFDIGESSHDRTNREILIEIVALAQCQFMVHGLSAVTESSIWISLDLHDTSVNLEDRDRVSSMVFGTLVQMALRQEPKEHWPTRRKMYEWWKPALLSGSNPQSDLQPSNTACSGYQGVLLISRVGPKDTAGMAFFHSILNQLLYAEMHNLKPLIHLNEEASLIYDDKVHSQGQRLVLEFLGGHGAFVEHDEKNVSATYPGKPQERNAEGGVRTVDVSGNGIWNSYFQPVSNNIRPGDGSCQQATLISLEPELVSPGLPLWCPWCIRTWRYDGVPDHLWNPASGGLSLKEWYAQMRQKGHAIVKKYFKFLPHLERRANQINPTTDANNKTVPCLAIHFRNILKKGNHRSLVKAKEFQPYMEAFQRAGGKSIFIATDSHRVLQLMTNSDEVPESLQRMIKSQGPYAVRSSGGRINKWPVHALGDHHRINSEMLADVLAMSKCQLFLHGQSSTSEAVFYLNPSLQEASLNMEDPRMTPEEFENIARGVLAKHHSEDFNSLSLLQNKDVTTDKLLARNYFNTTVLTRDPSRLCRRNAIIYLAQKEHSTYGRDSYAILKKSLELLYKNYLSLADHRENTDLFIFHTGDFNGTDLLAIESQFGSDYHGMLRFVDLSGSTYWQRPTWHINDDPNKAWYAYPLFSEGYRHMMHWYAIGLWDFFERYNQATGCSYRYLFRLDEDSYLHSPIRYNMFDFMKSNDYVYGYRMCAYEMRVTQRIQKVYQKKKGEAYQPVRNVDLDMCGFYNNFFVADIQHFRSPQVQEFLRIVDRQGLIYRRRLGDLMIHSLSVYFFAQPERIHRFLDFTYQHSTEDQDTGCVVWGGIEAGYDDTNAEETLNNYYQKQVLDLNCSSNATFLSEADLSPTYSHLPSDLKGRLFLLSIMSGNVEKPGKGILSG